MLGGNAGGANPADQHFSSGSITTLRSLPTRSEPDREIQKPRDYRRQRQISVGKQFLGPSATATAHELATQANHRRVEASLASLHAAKENVSSIPIK
jgi:hypothetical protein